MRSDRAPITTPAATVKPEQAPQRREPDQAGAGRAGKADMRQRVAGKRLPAHHQEVADNAGHHGDDAGGGEGIGHEFILKHVSFLLPSPHALLRVAGRG
jgi:hypothetical protein